MAPQPMVIEFQQVAQASGASEVFSRMVEWIDRQISKAVLGQTATTEGTPGKLGNEASQEAVRQDIIAADARQLANTLNRDLWKEEQVRAFTVAKAMTQELLIEIRQAVDAALAEGKTFKQFQDELEPLLGKRGWLGKVLMKDGSMVELGTPRRLKIIYDTHMRTARAAGQWVRIERNKAALPYLRYGLGPSREHRLQHVQWEGLILPVDDPFWDTHLPPNGWGCRCRVRQMTQREVDKRGGRAKTPKMETRQWKNRRTGKVEAVPTGIDPGWNYHPGKARLSRTQTFGKEKDIEFRSIVGTIR